MTEPVNTRRVRPGFRRAAIIVVVLLLPVAAHALWDYVEIRRLVREIDAIRAKGEPVTEQEAGRGYRRLSAEEDLAARHFRAAAALADPAVEGGWGATAPLHQLLAGHPPRNFDLGGIIRDLADRIQQGRAALELADRAVTLPFNGFTAGTSYSYRTSELLALAQLQRIRTAHASLTGRPDEAIASAIASLESRPTIEETFAWERANYDVPIVLSFTTPAPETLRLLLAHMQAQDRPGDVERAVLGDRAAFLDRVFSQYYGGDPRAPHATGGGSRGLVQVLWRPWVTRQVVEALRVRREFVEASRKPWPEKSAAMAAIYDRASSGLRPRLPFSSEGSVVRTRWWLPPASGFLFAMPPRSFDGLARDRASVAALGVALYRADHGGELPATLQELEGKYLAELTVDPFTGEPLRYRRAEDSFTIYSVGPDRRDDGGDLTSQLAAVDARGWGRRELAGKDVGIRVLLRPPASSSSSSGGE